MQSPNTLQSNTNINISKKSTLLKNLHKNWQLYLMMALPVFIYCFFEYIPYYGAQIAFKDYSPVKGFAGSEWVGLKHFTRFVNSYQFWRLIKNTLSISIYQLIIGTPFPIILALCLNYAGNKIFKKTVQMASYAPHFISTVVMVGMIMQFLDTRSGFVNLLLKAFGQETVNFMAKSELFSSIYVWSGIWQNVGYSSIVYLAALAGIDAELHEASIIDGATKVQRMLYIDIPGILPTIIILLIMQTGQILNIGFEKILLMQNSLNLSASEVISTYVFKVGIGSSMMNFSYATAIGLFNSVISLIIISSVNRLAKKMDQIGLW